MVTISYFLKYIIKHENFRWNNSVTIIEIDMRFLASLLNNGILDRPDIVGFINKIVI
jgi:hypothetical protein